MKVKFPKYYSRFACIKGECRDSCCIGWDIEVDEKTKEKYDTLDGSLGERVRAALITEDNATYIKTDCRGRCPFLNSEGLCDIISGCGEEMTSDICRRHPRYLTRVDGITEGGIGLSCLSAAMTVLSAKAKELSFQIFELPYDVEDSYGMLATRLERSLVKYRNDLLKTIKKRDTGAAFALMLTLGEGDILMRYVDFDQDPDMPCERVEGSDAHFTEALADVTKEVLEKLGECEMLSEDFGKRVLLAADYVSDKPKAFGEYLEGKFKPFFKRLLFCFLHRYYLEGLVDCSIGARTKLAGIYALALGALCFSAKADTLEKIAEVSTEFSKNIEYSEENTEKNLRDIYSYYIYTLENLDRMFNK